ncbi:MAG TPA: XdhC family protein, partial [Bacillota bacterium]|nr:XdhC family protein [Bacillota bacterium]
ADRVICADFRQALAELTLTPLTYLVIVTRGHRHDKVCLRQVVTQPAAYIGMIGSRRRVRILLDELKAEGILPEYLSRVHSPIGLAIGAETPAEIAVSILAEIVAARNGTKGQSLQLVKGSD